MQLMNVVVRAIDEETGEETRRTYEVERPADDSARDTLFVELVRHAFPEAHPEAPVEEPLRFAAGRRAVLVHELRPAERVSPAPLQDRLFAA